MAAAYALTALSPALWPSTCACERPTRTRCQRAVQCRPGRGARPVPRATGARSLQHPGEQGSLPAAVRSTLASFRLPPHPPKRLWCIGQRSGWWTYKVCHGANITQYHSDPANGRPLDDPVGWAGRPGAFDSAPLRWCLRQLFLAAWFRTTTSLRSSHWAWPAPASLPVPWISTTRGGSRTSPAATPASLQVRPHLCFACPRQEARGRMRYPTWCPLGIGQAGAGETQLWCMYATTLPTRATRRFAGACQRLLALGWLWQRWVPMLLLALRNRAGHGRAIG